MPISQTAKPKDALSIVVPTLNEADNLRNLVDRIDLSLDTAAIPYEIVIVDDNSTDDTAEVALRLARHYPVRLVIKEGARGKANSLLQGFSVAQYSLVVMIDADLQYPPEEIVPMYKLMKKHNADIVVTRRDIANLRLVRKISSSVFNTLFARLLFGINFDTQSGLKLFKKDILQSFILTPSPWSFDLEFLVRSLENGYRIMDHRFVFEERVAGVTKVKLLGTTIELAKAALKLRWQSSPKKIRKGYRQNIRFIKQTISVAVLALVVSGVFAFAHPSASSADALTPAVTGSLTQQLKQVTNILHLTSDASNSPVNNATVAINNQADNVVSPVIIPLTSTINSDTTPAGSTTSTTPSSATATTTKPQVSTTAATSASASNLAVGTAATTASNSTASPKATQSKVVSGGNQAIYATPAALNTSVSHLLNMVWKAALGASAFCFVIVMVMKGVRLLRHQHIAAV